MLFDGRSDSRQDLVIVPLEIQSCLAVVEHMNQVLVFFLAVWAGLSFPLLPKVEVCVVLQGVMHCIQSKLEVM